MAKTAKRSSSTGRSSSRSSSRSSGKSSGSASRRGSSSRSGSSSKSAGGRSTGKRRSSAKRELIDTGRDKRFVRRDSKGQFNESDDVGRSLAQDVRRHAKTKSKPGQGDRGDR